MEGQARVLVIDDEPDFVDSLKMILESASYEVIYAYDGEEGMRKAREEKPDVIILDVMMPGKDGYVVCRELKHDPQLSNIPVLLLTAVMSRMTETSWSVLDGLMIESEDYIDKPVNPQELLRRVKELLRRSKN